MRIEDDRSAWRRRRNQRRVQQDQSNDEFKGAWEAETFQACKPYSHLDSYALVEWVPGSLLTDVPENKIAEIGEALLDRGVLKSVYNGTPFRWYSARQLNKILAYEIRTSEGKNLDALEEYIKSALDDVYNQFGFRSARISKLVRAMAGTGDKLPCQYRGKAYSGVCVYKIAECYGCLAWFISSKRQELINDLLRSGQILVFGPIGKSDLYQFKPHQVYDLPAYREQKARYVLLRDLVPDFPMAASQQAVGNRGGRPPTAREQAKQAFRKMWLAGDLHIQTDGRAALVALLEKAGLRVSSSTAERARNDLKDEGFFRSE